MMDPRTAAAIHHLTHNIYVRAKASPIHGVGLFAIRDIPEGADPFQPSPIDGRLWIPEELLAPIPKPVRDLMNDIWIYEDGRLFVELHRCMNFVQLDYIFINHSGTPNLIINHGPPGRLSWTAREPIAAGQELTEDYAFLE